MGPTFRRIRRFGPREIRCGSDVSQVILSFGIPAAQLPLLWFCAQPGIMGSLVNRRSTTIVAGLVATVIVILNVVLLYLTFSGN